jgi:uncharacterized protein YndB with AHSA1/START domain
MTTTLTANVTVSINAPVKEVWQALTDPAKIKQYLFGTDTITDWKKGSEIRYKGVWDGRVYEDKGKIIDIIPEKKLHTTYYSSNSGKPDLPENYNNVIYELKPEGDQTVISVSQDNIKTEEELQHMKENWSMVLYGMKKLVEHKV